MNDAWPAAFEDLLRAHLNWLDPGEPLPADTALSDLGLDSVGVVSLLVDLEDRLAIVVPDEMIGVEMFSSAAALWDTIRQLGTVPS